jgi:hypothetical protein
MGMDCEKVESAIMDELYGELDEVTSAAVKRHIAGCSRCSALLSGLRATRRVSAVPMVDPPAYLEARILRRAGAVSTAAPLQGHLARAVSAAGSWAMRPQTAMAAVFLVMLGASVLLLRGRSSRAPASSEMIVTEQGTPAPAPPGAPSPPPDESPGDLALAASAARPLGTRPVGSLSATSAPDLGSGAPRERASAKAASPAKPEEALLALKSDTAATHFASAPAAGAAPSEPAPPAARGAGRPSAADLESPDSVEPAANESAGSAGLAAAVAIRDSQGCRAAVARFDEVAQRAAGSSAGWQSLLDSAICYRSLGDVANARARLTTLLAVAQFKDRARAELEVLDRASQTPP